MGEDGLLDRVADDDITADRLTGRVHGHKGRCIQSELDLMAGHLYLLPRDGTGWSAGRLEQLEIEHNLHHVAERDSTDPGRHRDVDAEVLAANLSRGLEAGVPRAARE